MPSCPQLSTAVCWILNSFAADIVFIGPTGTGKSSLIGSLCRSVTQQEHFPDKIRQTLNHPDSGHGTLHWLESPLNTKGNIVLQDTRGDQSFDAGERTLHNRALQGFYQDGTLMGSVAPLSKDWWKQRWFWQRGSLSDSPHCVVFVFDGSVEPFLDGESLAHYKELFQLCTEYGGLADAVPGGVGARPGCMLLGIHRTPPLHTPVCLPIQLTFNALQCCFMEICTL